MSLSMFYSYDKPVAELETAANKNLYMHFKHDSCGRNWITETLSVMSGLFKKVHVLCLAMKIDHPLTAATPKWFLVAAKKFTLLQKIEKL